MNDADLRLPGDLTGRQFLERAIRVDHAGEYGAVRIYAGQLAVLGPGPARDSVQVMADQEARHLAAFEALLARHRVRPTLFGPVWHLAGFALGAASAALGPQAAMACTVAVEDVIEGHYRRQSERLGDDETELRETIDDFRAEEVQHRDMALAEGAEQAPGYGAISAGIRAASRLAIWLSERA